jgi:hypothetical protein
LVILLEKQKKVFAIVLNAVKNMTVSVGGSCILKSPILAESPYTCHLRRTDCSTYHLRTADGSWGLIKAGNFRIHFVAYVLRRIGNLLCWRRHGRSCGCLLYWWKRSKWRRLSLERSRYIAWADWTAYDGFAHTMYLSLTN